MIAASSHVLSLEGVPKCVYIGRLFLGSARTKKRSSSSAATAALKEAEGRAVPRYLQMLDHQLRSRKMANLDRIDWLTRRRHYSTARRDRAMT
jgi:hypothetical protein